MNELVVRRATELDSRSIFNWRNDELTRAASLSTTEISWQDHQTWFGLAIGDERLAIYIVEAQVSDCSEIGMCRFDLIASDQAAEVSINLNPRFRGRGLGTHVLHAAISLFQVEHPLISELRARIKIENIPSLKIFLTEGFCESSETEGVIQLQKSLDGQASP